MAIQFCCTSCGHPIEVDDEHAGRSAACPYCRHVVVVPLQSTYDGQAAPTARPAEGTPSPPMADASGGPGTAPGTMAPVPGAPPYPDTRVNTGVRQRAARTFGNYATICTGLVVAMFAITLVYSLASMVKSGVFTATSQPTPIDMRELQKQLGHQSWVIGLTYGSMFFALAGLALGIVSLVQSRQRNWRGITAIVVCGLFLICNCVGGLVGALVFGGPGA